MKRFICAAALIAATPVYAVEYQSAMNAYLQNNITQWAQDPALVTAILAQNATLGALPADQIDAMDKAWRAEVGAAASPTIDAVLDAPASDHLRDIAAATNGVVTEIFIMDANGLNVAASAVTSDYWQGDEAKFQQTYAVGADAVHFSDVEFDESSQTYQAQISVAITDPATGQVIGAMTVGLDAEALM